MVGRAKVSPENPRAPKVEAFPAYNEIATKHAKKDFPVLLKVTAPRLPPEVTSLQTPMRAAVDLVVVLDIGASMTERMDDVKHAMLKLIQELHWEKDRLCIVAFSEKTDCSGFLKMNDTGKLKSVSIINNLNATGNSSCMGKALEDAAAEILKNPNQTSYRAGFILFLSASNYDSIDKSLLIDSFPIPTYTFGLDDHNPDVLYEIAEKTRGTYSFIYKHIKDKEAIKDGILPLIRCLKSIVATDMRIVVRPQKGVAISSVETGAYDKEVRPDYATIDIDDISAGETKNITVLVDILGEDEQPFFKQLLPSGKAKTVPILTVDGEYTDTMLTNSKVSTDKIQVSVVRTDRPSSGKGMCPQVAEEERRRTRVSCMSQLIDNPTEEEWDEFRESYGVHQDVSELVQSFRDVDDEAKIAQARRYTLSWLSSERWQRQTTKGDPSDNNVGAPQPSRLRRLPHVVLALAVMVFSTLQGQQGGMGPAPQMAMAPVIGPMPSMAPMDMAPAVCDAVEPMLMQIVGLGARRRLLEVCALPHSHHVLQDDNVHCALHQIQYLQPFLCLATMHSRFMGTCSAQLPEHVSDLISQLGSKDEREELKQAQLPYKAENSMLKHESYEEVLKRMEVEVLLKVNTDTAQLQLGHHSTGEIKDDLGSLFKEVSRQRAHRRTSRARAGMPRTTYTELGCLVAAY